MFSEVGSASFVDPNTVALENGHSLQGEKFILCTGGHVRRLDFPGAKYALTHSDLWSAQALPRSIAIVGAAATSCQLAAILATFGAHVSLLEISPRILRAEDVAVSEAITASFHGYGIEVITGIGGIERIEKNAKGLTLFYTQNDDLYNLEVETEILSSGWLGNVCSLLQQSGAIVSGNTLLW